MARWEPNQDFVEFVREEIFYDEGVRVLPGYLVNGNRLSMETAFEILDDPERFPVLSRKPIYDHMVHLFGDDYRLLTNKQI